MKIAVLLSGEPRFADIAGKLFWRDVPSHYEVDVFIHAWSENSRRSEGAPEPDLTFSSWRPKALEVTHKRDEYQRLGSIGTQDIFLFKFGQILSFSKVCKVFEPFQNDGYDLIIKGRLDGYFKPEGMAGLDKYLLLDKDIYYWEIPDKIFIEACHFDRNRMIVSDYSFISATPGPLQQFMSNIDDWVIKEAIQHDPWFYHHTKWHDLASERNINLIPTRIGKKIH